MTRLRNTLGQLSDLMRCAKNTASVQKSVEIIERSRLQNISTPGLAMDSGLSQRTLEYAFINHFGFTPQVYIGCFQVRYQYDSIMS